MLDRGMLPVRVGPKICGRCHGSIWENLEKSRTRGRVERVNTSKNRIRHLAPVRRDSEMARSERVRHSLL